MLGDGQGPNEFLNLPPHRDDARTRVIALQNLDRWAGRFRKSSGIVATLIEHLATRFTKSPALAAFL
jgi:hypothetical protein